MIMVTRKVFQWVADAIHGVTLMAAEPDGGTIGTLERREALRAGADIARNQIAQWLADDFARDNPQFNRSKFMTACGLG